MRRISTEPLVVAIVGAALVLGGMTAQAAPLGPASARAIPSQAGQGGDNVTLAQAVIPHWRLGRHYNRHHGYRHHGWRGHHGYHGHRGWRHRHRDRDDVGAAIAGGIIGLAAGAIIAGSASRGGRTVQYCINRFRSYDVASRTYLGYDGRRHSCP